MDGSTTRDTGQLALSSAGDMLDQNSSSGKKVRRLMQDSVDGDLLGVERLLTGSTDPDPA